jgi:hypothetical protein
MGAAGKPRVPVVPIVPDIQHLAVSVEKAFGELRLKPQPSCWKIAI